MKKIITLILLLCFKSVSFCQNIKKGTPSTLLDSIYSVGKIVNDKKEGPWVYYKHGNIIRTSYFKSDKLEKVTLIFFDSGGLARSIPFKDGAITGNVNFYSKNGELIAIYQYESDGYLKTLMQKVSPDAPPKGHAYNPLDVF